MQGFKGEVSCCVCEGVNFANLVMRRFLRRLNYYDFVENAIEMAGH